MKPNVRKLHSSLAKLKTAGATRNAGRCHCLGEGEADTYHTGPATAKTASQSRVQMGPCRARPVTALRTVGKIEISAQRLDLEGKHRRLLCHSGKSRTLVSHKWLTYLQNRR